MVAARWLTSEETGGGEADASETRRVLHLTLALTLTLALALALTLTRHDRE